MNITELKLGDIVKCGGRVVKITALGNTSICISDTKSTFESWVTCDNLTLIPLTKRILEKNEWVLRRPNVYIKEAKYYSLKIIIGNDYAYLRLVDFSGCEMFIDDIRYIHQLQHLLWAFGIDDNLKV